ncbi:hypothetical protein IWX49DRAFT_371532 [Phyllosticta citricarpa]|uniref:Uncharacterized protein n=2 Tax=Phyllosticta TaxID=121621 RepID=A0ABR1MIV9_9PEZI
MVLVVGSSKIEESTFEASWSRCIVACTAHGPKSEGRAERLSDMTNIAGSKAESACEPGAEMHVDLRQLHLIRPLYFLYFRSGIDMPNPLTQHGRSQSPDRSDLPKKAHFVPHHARPQTAWADGQTGRRTDGERASRVPPGRAARWLLPSPRAPTLHTYLKKGCAPQHNGDGTAAAAAAAAAAAVMTVDAPGISLEGHCQYELIT